MSKRRTREENITGRYHSGELESDEEARLDSRQRFNQQSRDAESQKMSRTALLRAEDPISEAELEKLPLGEVVQVFSRYSEVEHEGKIHLCIIRKTLQKLAETGMVVGDRVKFLDTGIVHESGRPEAIIENILPRETILTRAGTRRSSQQPIVANAHQMLIVVSLVNPAVKWGLVDRMIIAAQSGKLRPIVCLNKIDLAVDEDSRSELTFANEALAHYATLGIASVRTSIETPEGLDELRGLLQNRATVLSGHSGVGKSSLIRAIQPQLDLRVGEVSAYTAKGRHTTTSARRYKLDFGGEVIDTPGVKIFGLWNITRENLLEYFPDVDADTAPKWRADSYQRILGSLGGDSEHRDEDVR